MLLFLGPCLNFLTRFQPVCTLPSPRVQLLQKVSMSNTILAPLGKM